MEIQFIASVSVIAPNPPKSRELYVEALGLPRKAGELESKGFSLLHENARVAVGSDCPRLQSVEGLVIGVSYRPWLHD
jgi:hypothetical protein